MSISTIIRDDTDSLAPLREFPGLDPRSFQHPADLKATQALSRLPLFSALVKKISSSVMERHAQLMFSASSIRLGPAQGTSIYRKFEKAASILDLPSLPEIYLNSTLQFNAIAYGTKKYQIVLFAPLVDSLSEGELMAIIGHELGHLKCQHQLYMTVAFFMRTLGNSLFSNALPLGAGQAVSLGLQMAILNWQRSAELSCDRAALLVVQDSTTVARALSKLAGGSHKVLPEIHLDGVLEQADDYDDAGDSLLDKMLKVSMLAGQTHPFPIMRAREILRWADSDEYQAILSGSDTAPRVIENPGVLCGACGQRGSNSATFCRSCKVRLRGVTRSCAACRNTVGPAEVTCATCGNPLEISE